MIVSGIEVAARIFKRYDPSLEVRVRTKEGDRVEKGTILLDVKGAARSVLTTERTALNIAQRMSGIANETARYVAAIAGTKARLIDTRKTTPGLRMLEKHAVTCGGGLNHRIGLDKKSGQIADLTCSANCAFHLSYSIAPKRASYPHRTGDW
jgi:nicotinate-nucleotide pyrophosphorylase (carboxylating)